MLVYYHMKYYVWLAKIMIKEAYASYPHLEQLCQDGARHGEQDSHLE